MSAEQDKTEREMQQYLDRASPLSAQYRAHSRETTPPQLDSAVLAHAQEQLQSAFAMHRSQALRRRHRRWAIPLATAATMLVGVNLVWQLREQALPEAVSTASVEQDKAYAPAASAEALARAEPQAQSKAEDARQQAPESQPQRRALAAAPDVAASADVPMPSIEAMQVPLADSLSEPTVQRVQAESDRASAVGGAALMQRQSRVDSALEQRKHKASAASGFAAPMPAAVATSSAQDIAGDLLRWLRAEDYASIRRELAAPNLGDDMLSAAARTAKNLSPDVQGEISAAGDGLWRIDYRSADGSRRCTAMLQQAAEGWSLLRIDVQ